VSSKTAPEVSLLSARVSVPQHVVYRNFPAETVVLNLDTGKYHGLNPSAGRMLEALEQASSVRAAANALAQSYEQPLATIEHDLCELCEALRERGLIEIDGASSL
jgi:Coenzyme PQQ synthesis protein D (PqqD)